MSFFRSLFLIFSFFVNNYFFSQEQIQNLANQNEGKLIENKGQWPKGVLFNTQMEGGKIWFQQNKMIYHLQDYSTMHEAHAMKNTSFTSDVIKETVVHVNFVGSNQVDDIEKKGKSKMYYNFFKGNDQSKWASDVHGYETFILKNFYDGIDFKVSSTKSNLKYELLVKVNSNLKNINLEYIGQDKLFIDRDGNLVIETALGKVIEKKPFAYQLVDGKQVEVKCNFKINGNFISFDIGEFDASKDLIIDPTLVFATYNGAVSDNFGMTATYGHDGTAYSGGTVYGNNYPNPDPLAFDVNSNFTAVNGNYGITDVFVSKYSADGSQMIWGTFIGGGDNTQGTETIHSMICDLQDNLYFFGATSSNDFPTTNGAFDVSFNGGNNNYNTNFYYNGVYFQNLGTDIYVAKLSSNGHTLIGSTYVGGTGNDGVNYEESNLPYNGTFLYSGLNSNYGDQSRGEIMLDMNNNILIASCTRSIDFPTINSIQATFGGIQDGVLFKLTNNFSSLLYSTYYGGANRDACYSVKVDNAQNVLFAGGTQSANLPGISSSWQINFAGSTDGFVVKLPPIGNTITAASYVGTAGYDQVFFVEFDRNDNIFVLGQSVGTTSDGYIPIVNAGYSNGFSSNFIIKFDPNLDSIVKSTRFGNGSNAIHISPAAFLVDNCGNIYVSGWGANILQATPLTGMPVTLDAFQASPPNGFDFYLFVLKGDFNSLLYGTYIGGNQAQEHVDGGTSRFDKNGVVYQSVCGGCGMHSDFPTTQGAWSSTNNSNNCNNLIFKFSTGIMPVANFSADQTIGCANFTVQFDNFSTAEDSYLWDFGNGNLDSITFEPTITYTEPGIYNVMLYVTDSVCLLTDTAQISVIVYPPLQTSMQDLISLCEVSPITVNPTIVGSPNVFLWSTSPLFSDTLNSDLTTPQLDLSSPTSGYYYFSASDSLCKTVDSFLVELIELDIELVATDSICSGELATIYATNLAPSIELSYLWSPTSIIVNNQNNLVQVNPTNSQMIYVTVTGGGCDLMDSTFINVSTLDSALVEASASDYIVLPGTIVTLYGEPTGMDSYSWSPVTDLTNPTSQQSTAVVNETTIYTLSVTQDFCTRTDTTEIKVYEIICEDPYVFIPNAFSPNGDNENDILYVRGIWIEKMIFRIFDRWGEMVFESTDPTIGWDGTFKDRKLDPDVYDYYLDVTCIGGLKSIVKGNVTLMK